jgi:hypothetical protein
MNVFDFKQQLAAHPEKPVAFQLPDGGFIAANFHVTELGHVKKNFVDCGGIRRSLETCLLQTWVADDTDHQLTAGKLALIFELGADLLPHEELPVEVEYEDYVIAQFPVQEAAIMDGALVFRLGLKHTDCLAKERCLPGVCC